MKINAKILFLLCILFMFTKEDTETIDFNGTTYNTSFENKQNITTFKITVSNSSNYLKIVAKGFGEQTTINHIISYHKNEKNLNEREQLSQSGNETTIMFLNKKQIEKEFFISIQCDKTPCNYSLALEKSDYAELSVNDAISYYVTEANEEMKFKIFGNATEFFSDEPINTTRFLTIYAIGNLEVNSFLEIVKNEKHDNSTILQSTNGSLEDKSTIENFTNYTKHTNYSAYLIKINEKNETKDLILTVKGKQGDMINIGSYFMKNEDSSKELKLNDRFVFGYLKKNLLPKVCFEMPSGSYSSYNLAFVGNLDKPLLTNGKFLGGVIYKYYSCIEIPNTADYDEYVYYMQVYDRSVSKSFNSLQPQILGSSFIYQLYRGESVPFFFNLADKSFFNYEAYVLKGYLETFYVECDNFPLCELNYSKPSNNTKKIYNINHFANLVLDEKKLQNVSPISQKQYIILNKCVGDYYNCIFMNFGYSNNNKITMNKKCTYHKYLLKNSQSIVKFSAFPSSNFDGGSDYNCLVGDDDDKLDKNYYVVSIMVYSGSLDVKVASENKTIEPEVMENYKQFLFNITKNNISDAIINIKAKENAFYSIIAMGGARFEKYYSNDLHGYINVISTGSYVLGLKNQKENDLILFNNLYDYSNGYYYMGFKFHNCKFNITKKSSFKTISNNEVKDNYYQDIYYLGTTLRGQIYSANRVEEKTNDKCLVNVYSYKTRMASIQDQINTEEIFLMDNVAQKFIFNHSYNYIQFLYPNVEIEKDLNVEIKNPNKANFTVTYYFNNVTFNNSKSISTDKNSFTIKKNEWQNVCKENTIVCGISFGVSFIYNSQISNATFEITASHDAINSGGSGGKNKSSSFMIYLLIIIGAVVLLAIILIVVCICKSKKSNEDLKNNVITTSFASSDEKDTLI